MSEIVEPRLTYGIKEVMRKVGLSRPSVYRAIQRGELRPCKIGRRTLITADELEAWVAASRGTVLRPSIYMELMPVLEAVDLLRVKPTTPDQAKVMQLLELPSRRRVWIHGTRK